MIGRDLRVRNSSRCRGSRFQAGPSTLEYLQDGAKNRGAGKASGEGRRVVRKYGPLKLEQVPVFRDRWLLWRGRLRWLHSTFDQLSGNQDETGDSGSREFLTARAVPGFSATACSKQLHLRTNGFLRCAC